MHFSTRLVYTLGHAREMRLSVLHRIIDILIIFRRGSRKFLSVGVQLCNTDNIFFRGERIQTPLKAGQHRPASETPFNSSLALRISGGPDPLSHSGSAQRMILNTQLILGRSRWGGVSVIQKTLNPLQSRRKVPSVLKVFKCFI